MAIQERYTALVLGVNASGVITTNSTGGFLAVTSGTLTLSRFDIDGSYITVVNGVPVTAGVYTPMPFFLGVRGGLVVLAGGASGTLGV